MKKIIMAAVSIVFSIVSAFADTLLVMPITVVEEDGSRIRIEKDLDKYIYNHLLGYDFDGLIEFSNPSSGRYGNVNSIVDAERVCAISNAEYIMYGYVEKRSDSWFCNIRFESSILN